MPNSTTRAFLKTWLDRKSLEADEATHERYTGVATQFLDHIKHKANADIKKITPTDVADFRAANAKRLDDNPAERVSILKKKKKTGDVERRAFTLAELKQITLAADGEWRGMILFGLYTGQRLGDIAILTKKNLFLAQSEVCLTTDKTNRRQILPLAVPLRKYIKTLTLDAASDAPLFPRACELVQRQGRTGNLSNRFHKILVAAGLAEKRSHHGTGKGRSALREQNEISFHSLRHTATTLLKAAGVSDAIAREFVGHESAAVSRDYTPIPIDTLQQAASKLPDIYQ